MSTLFINQKYYDKFLESNSKKVIQLYGYADRDVYFKEIIKFLNDKYSFLNVSNFEIMPQEEAQTYQMYNGYIRGAFTDYDEVIVSFSDPYTKEGNTIISQQVMPMLQKKISENPNFLYDKRIKKIFLLTSHKAAAFKAESNCIREDSRGSTLQLLVKCLNTLGFDVHSFIPILNLETSHKFSSIQELIDDIAYIQNQNPGNLQHKYIELIGNRVIGSFAQKPKGQDEKYFAIRFLTAIMLNNNNLFDISQAYHVSEKSQMIKMLLIFSNYVERNNLTLTENTEMSDEEYIEILKKEDEFIEKLKKLADKYGDDGNKIVTSLVRLPEVQKELRKRLIKKYGCKCLMCNTTNEELLIASHIKQSGVCDIYDKADIENAFLLCANHDKLFDKYLISFKADDGKIMISDQLTDDETELCNLDFEYYLPSKLLTDKRRKYLIWHNKEFEKKNGKV